jgi:hypothetical protein
VELLLDEHKKILIQLFMKGEEMKGEKKPAALMLAHLISTPCNCHGQMLRSSALSNAGR